MHLPISDRCEAAVTMSYEAQARLQDPIYGCVAHIFSLQQQVVLLQAQLESLKAQATQEYGDGSLTSNPQKENCQRVTLQDGQFFFHPTVPSNSSVEEENQLYFGNDCFTSGSIQYSVGYEADLCMPDHHSSNPSCTVQGIGYHGMGDLQSVAFAYLNQA
ncbi:hypothetical protein PR202_ga21833 [Eleusine coracana subsp. coracana]|uniref:LOB domain-containing protein n=1 Tax=Eleusine coracana subsp. coracana TaxID=191504 RepID=A0AAV5D200_ELECO|nr:hypothetical protein PR202_ga21833 [Eleusine coracana subsp. coracana]